MQKKKVLLVEDELAIREMMKFAFINSDYQLLEAEDAEQAQLMIVQEHPNLILLDWMLPGISGIELAKRLKENDSNNEIPIIMLTARSEETDRIRGFDAGIDDYVIKPFSPKELLARIKAVLRRVSPENEGGIELGGICFNNSHHRISIKDKVMSLGPTEYKLLHFFMTHPERVYTREQLLDYVWGGDVYIEERTVDVHIRRLRKAMSEFDVAHLIQTVRGSGYRFSVE
ncbi:MAG: phosphate regulon transcriptional regulator PhoB [Gammaproteobacteria bacterium]|nr:phosphate regulon transcriptional regulator PhoB [Gammaproteobacteria bacterium]